MAFPLVASGAIDIIDKSQYYFLEADEVTLKNNDNEFLFFSYKEGGNIKTFSYFCTANLEEMQFIDESLFLNIIKPLKV